MKPEYEHIEEPCDDTARIRTMTEQAPLPGKAMPLRDAVCSRHHPGINVTLMPGGRRGGEKCGP